MSLARVVCRRCLDAHISSKLAQRLISQKRSLSDSRPPPVPGPPLIGAQSPRAKHIGVNSTGRSTLHIDCLGHTYTVSRRLNIKTYGHSSSESCLTSKSESLSAGSYQQLSASSQLRNVDGKSQSNSKFSSVGGSQRQDHCHSHGAIKSRDSLDLPLEETISSSTPFRRKVNSVPNLHVVRDINTRVGSTSRLAWVINNSRHLHTATQTVPRRRSTDMHLQVTPEVVMPSSKKSRKPSRSRRNRSVSTNGRPFNVGGKSPTSKSLSVVQLQAPLQDLAYIESHYNPDNLLKLKAEWKQNPKSPLSNYVREKTGEALTFHIAKGIIGSKTFYRCAISGR